MKRHLAPERGDEVVFRTAFSNEIRRGTYVRYYMYLHLIDVKVPRGKRRYYVCNDELLRVIPDVRHDCLQT